MGKLIVLMILTETRKILEELSLGYFYLSFTVDNPTAFCCLEFLRTSIEATLPSKPARRDAARSIDEHCGFVYEIVDILNSNHGCCFIRLHFAKPACSLTGFFERLSCVLRVKEKMVPNLGITHLLKCGLLVSHERVKKGLKKIPGQGFGTGNLRGMDAPFFLDTRWYLCHT